MPRVEAAARRAEQQKRAEDAKNKSRLATQRTRLAEAEYHNTRMSSEGQRFPRRTEGADHPHERPDHTNL